jgi:ActD protein
MSAGRPRDLVVGRFHHEGRVVDAVEAIRSRGLRVFDVYSPYPLHRLDEAMAMRRSRLPAAALAGGLLGLFAALALELYTSVIDWPLNVGGKPDNSMLAFIPIAFELTVLGAGLLTCAAFLVRCRLLPRLSAPIVDRTATDDTFAVVVRCRDTAFDRRLVEELLLDYGAWSVISTSAER